MTEADRLALYEAALRTIQDAIAGYLHPEQRLTKDQFIDAVLAAADDRELVKALREPARPVSQQGVAEIRNELARREEAGHDARVPLKAPTWAAHLTTPELKARLTALAGSTGAPSES